MDTTVVEDLDNEEDIPDDFFDDFANVDFIEGLNVIDSWEPPVTETIVIDDDQNSDNDEKQHSKQDISHANYQPKDIKRSPKSDNKKDNKRITQENNTNTVDTKTYRKFEAPIRKYKPSPVRNSNSPHTEERRLSKRYYSGISSSHSRKGSSPYRRRSRDSRKRSHDPTSRDFRWRTKRSRSKDYNRDRYRSRSRYRNSDDGRKIKESNDDFRIKGTRKFMESKDNFRGKISGHADSSLSSFSISPEVRRENFIQRTHTKLQELHADNIGFIQNDANLYNPNYGNVSQNINFNLYQSFDAPYNTPTMVPPPCDFQYSNEQHFVNSDDFTNRSQSYLVNPPMISNSYEQNMQIDTNYQTAPEKVSSSENKSQTMKSKVETEAKKLFAEKKLSLSEFLMMSAKSAESTKETSSVGNKVMILSRCNEALQNLKHLEDFPKNFVFDETLYPDFPRVINPLSKYCSPLRKMQVFKFRYTTMPDVLLKTKTQRIRTLIKTLNIKFNDYVKNNVSVGVQSTPSSDNTKVAHIAISSDKYHKFIQTDTYECNDCKARKEIQMKDMSCQVDLRELLDFSSSRFDNLSSRRFMTRAQQFSGENDFMNSNSSQRNMNDSIYTNNATTSVMNMRVNSEDFYNIHNRNSDTCSSEYIPLEFKFGSQSNYPVSNGEFSRKVTITKKKNRSKTRRKNQKEPPKET